MPFGTNYISGSTFLNELLKGMQEAKQEELTQQQQQQQEMEKLKLEQQKLKLREKEIKLGAFKPITINPGQTAGVLDLEKGTLVPQIQTPYEPEISTPTETAEGVIRYFLDPETGRWVKKRVGGLKPTEDLSKAQNQRVKRYQDTIKMYFDMYKNVLPAEMQILADPEEFSQMIKMGNPEALQVYANIKQYGTPEDQLILGAAIKGLAKELGVDLDAFYKDLFRTKGKIPGFTLEDIKKRKRKSKSKIPSGVDPEWWREAKKLNPDASDRELYELWLKRSRK